MSIARYTMLSHEKENPNPKRYADLYKSFFTNRAKFFTLFQFDSSYDVLTKGKKVFNTDGLNNLQYTLVETQVHQLYTLLLVELHPPS